MRYLIIGGSDAGISAALRAQEIDPNAKIDVLLEDNFPNYSICGLPFYLSDETPDRHSLAHRTQFDGLSIHRGHRATRIDGSSKTVEIQVKGSGHSSLPYDKLLIATGASPVIPHIEGWRLPGVFLLHTMNDSFAVHEYLDRVKPRRAVIVGAGYIGLEMADALTHRGIEVTVASRTKTVLATVDPEFGKAVGEELEHHGVAVATSVEAQRIVQVGDHLRISGSEGFEQDC